MKKLIFISITVLFLLNSCKKELESISLNPSSISMHYDESEQLEVSYSPSDLEVPPEFNWYTDNEKVAEIDQDGIVYGVKVGETIVYAETTDKKFQASCNVKIIPASNLYKEPVIKLGESKAYVKSNETRVIEDEIIDVIYYKGENSRVRNVFYMFDNGKLDASIVLLANQIPVAEEVLNYLDERYYFQFTGDGSRYYFTQDEKVAVVVGVDDTLGLNVIYMSNSDNKSTSSIIDNYNQILNYLK